MLGIKTELLRREAVVEKTIAILEDEPDIAEMIALHLRKANFHTEVFLKPSDFWQYLEKKVPDLLVLDLMLPEQDGLEVCRNIRKNPKWAALGVIMLTAKGEEIDKVVGLELGADDYMTKPFSPKELAARIRAVLRRKGDKKSSEHIRTIDNFLNIDLQKHEVTVDDKIVKLTVAEFKILELLSSKRGWVFSRDQLLDYLWGQEKAVVDRTIDVHIRHLRTKLGDKAAALIVNIRGVGYKLKG